MNPHSPRSTPSRTSAFRRRSHRLALLPVLAALSLGQFGCGEESDQAGEAALEEYIPVSGYLSFGSQCPYGTISAPDRIPSALWECPLELEQLRIQEPPKPLFLQADCRKKLVSLRTQDGSSDLSWQTMPDGSFSMTLENQEMVLEDDGSGRPGPCRVKARVEVMGNLKCTDRDRIEIPFESVWWLHPEPLAGAAPSPSPSPSPLASSMPPENSYPPGFPFFPWREDMPNARPIPSPEPELRECRFADTCYLHAPHVLKQCQ